MGWRKLHSMDVFAKLNHSLGDAAARTVEALVTAIGDLVGSYTAHECANYFDWEQAKNILL